MESNHSLGLKQLDKAHKGDQRPQEKQKPIVQISKNAGVVIHCRTGAKLEFGGGKG